MGNKHPKGPGVNVRDNNVDQALRALKKKLQREGTFREMKLRQHFEKPSEKKNREKQEGIKRQRKLTIKRIQNDTGVDKKTAKAMYSKGIRP